MCVPSRFDIQLLGNLPTQSVLSVSLVTVTLKSDYCPVQH